jgi:hypothetical protein
LLLGLQLYVGPLVSAVQVLRGARNAFSLATRAGWVAEHKPLVPIVVVAEVVAAAILLVFAVRLAVLFTLRRVEFRRELPIFVGVRVAYIFVDALVLAALDAPPEAARSPLPFGFAIGWLLAWGAYVKSSASVRATFVVSPPPARAPSIAPAPMLEEPPPS